MIILNWFEKWRIMKYNIYSSTLLYTYVSISTALRVCVTRYSQTENKQLVTRVFVCIYHVEKLEITPQLGREKL